MKAMFVLLTHVLAASAVVRRSVTADGLETATGDELLDNCAELAKAEWGLEMVKKIGGGGSGAVVFTTTAGTVVKCGANPSLGKEGEALKAITPFADPAASGDVVKLLKMTEAGGAPAAKNGMYAIEIELLDALEWKFCLGETRGKCVDQSGDQCNGAAGCFPPCVTKHGNGPAFFDRPLTYDDIKLMVVGHLEANLQSCRASWVQMDGSSGMNVMIDRSGGEPSGVTLIDFEQAVELGEWGAKWCKDDMIFVKNRIDEAVQCLAADDAFRVGLEEIGAELAAWEAVGPSKCGGQCHNKAKRIETGALAADIADAEEKTPEFIARVKALPTP